MKVKCVYKINLVFLFNISPKSVKQEKLPDIFLNN